MQLKIYKIFILTVLLLNTSINATELMTISFDKGLNADFAKGKKEVSSHKHIKLVKGLKGNGVYIPKNGVLDYSALNNIKADSGSVSMWIKLDWNPVLTGGAPPKGKPYIYRTLFCCGSGKRTTLAAMILKQGLQFGSKGQPMGLQLFKGDWTHLVFTWNKAKNKRLVYMNARLLDILPPFGNVELGELLCLGKLPGKSKRRPIGFEGVLDEFQVFDQDLNAAEIHKLYDKIFPLTISPMDYAGIATQKQQYRTRFINVSDQTKKAHYQLQIKQVKTGKIIDKITFNIQVSPQETSIKTFELTLPETSEYDFSLTTNNLVQKTWRVATISPTSITSTMPVSNTGDVKMKLIEEIDCTKEHSADKYRDDDHCQLVKSSLGNYRETSLRQPNSGFAYRVKFKNPSKPHWLEIDYPDNARRIFYVGFFPYSERKKRLTGSSLDNIGVITGGSHTITNTMQTKRLLFWPDAAEGMIMCGSFRWSRNAGAAVAKIRIYETIGDLPKLTINAPKTLPSRTFSIWQEDPGMTSGLWFNRTTGTTKVGFDFWRDKVDRMVKYLRFSGKNSWSLMAVDYFGENTGTVNHILPMTYLTSHSARIPGWLDLVATTFQRENIPFYVAINWCDKKRSIMRKMLGEENLSSDFSTAAAKGVQAFEMFSKDNKLAQEPYRFNPLHPKVKAMYLKLIAAYRDKYKVFSQFKGINFTGTSELSFNSSKNGYGDYNCQLFTKDTGINIPVSITSSTRFSERYQWLKENAWQEWITWRTEKLKEVIKELVAEINKGCSQQRQIITRIHVDAKLDKVGETLRKGENATTINNHLYESGIDLATVTRIKNYIILPTIRPNYNHKPSTPDERYYNFSPELAELFKEMIYPAILLNQISMLEIYMKLAVLKIKSLWWDVYARKKGDMILPAHSMAQPDNKYVLEHLTWALAETDAWMIDHGFWGCPENGAMSYYQRFHKAYLSIPRVHFEKADGSNDPVTVRVYNSGNEHWFYIVNKAYYPVKISMTIGPKNETILDAVNKKSLKLPIQSNDSWLNPIDWVTSETAIFSRELKGHEVLVFKCPAEVIISNFNQEIPAKESKRLLTKMSKVKTNIDLYQKIYGQHPKVASNVLKEAQYLYEQGLYSTAEHRLESLVLLDLKDSLTDNLRYRLFTDGILELKYTNTSNQPLSGSIDLIKWSKNLKWTPDTTKLKIANLAPGATYTGQFKFSGPKLTSKPHMQLVLKMTFNNNQQSITKDIRLRPYLVHYTPKGQDTKDIKWYQLDSQQNMFKKQTWKLQGLTQWKAKYGWSWNEAGLTLQVVVNDKDFIPPVTPKAMYLADCIQVYFDQLDNKSPGYDYNDLTYQVGLVNGKPCVWREHAAPGEGNKLAPEVEATIKRIGNETIYKVFFPASEFPHINLENGVPLGYSILINNLDKTEAGTVHSNMAPHKKPPFRNPWAWRDLLLTK